jgi:cytoskeletal protein RodZ
VYVRGFIKSYAAQLGIEAAPLLKIYNCEASSLSVDEASSRKRESRAKRSSWKEYLAVTPRMLTFLGSFAVIAVLGYYFLHQINSFNSKPYLFIDSPTADEVVKDKELTVSGKTEADAVLRINGQEISVGGEGNFSQKITLSPGRNVLVVEAKNRFNKTDTKEINIVYEKPQDRMTVEEIKPENEAKPLAQGDIVEEKPDAGAVLGVSTAAAKEAPAAEKPVATEIVPPAAQSEAAAQPDPESLPVGG